MANIMTSAGRPACALAGMLLIGQASASSDEGATSAYGSLPSGYSLSYDADRWSEEYSVFHLAVAAPGDIGSSFAASVDPRLRPLTRLDSSWNFTSPLGSLPMRVGDGVSSAGLWEQPARLAGVQIGSYQPVPREVTAPPSLIATPYQNMGPLALTSPRFVDQSRSMTQFEQPSLTPWGQSDYSWEAGRLRENFEVRSNDYGSWITSGTYRYGMSAGTTVAGEIAQVAGQQSFLGVGLIEGLGSLGMVSARVAGSRDPETTGWVARMGYDYTQDRFSVAVRSHIQSAGYQDVGDYSVTEYLRQRTLASAGIDLGSLGRLSVASAAQTYLDDTRRDVVALSHAVPFGSGGIVSTAAAYSPGQLANSTLWLSFTYPFDSSDMPAHRIDAALNSALERTIVDVFGPTRLPTARIPTDKSMQP